MNASNESALNTNAMPDDEHSSASYSGYGHKDRPGDRRVFWLATIGLILLGAAGLAGQLVGLQSIDKYSRIRGQLVSAKTESARLESEINTLRNDEASARAILAQATQELSRLQQRVAEARKSEELSLETASDAQTERSRAVAQRATAIEERDVAVAVRETAREEIVKLNQDISRLRQQRETLDSAVTALDQTRTNLTTTLTDLKRESDALHIASALLTEKRSELRKLESDLQSLHAKAEASQARLDQAHRIQADLAALEERRQILISTIAEKEQAKSRKQEQLRSIEDQLGAAQTKLTSSKAEKQSLSASQQDLSHEVSTLQKRADVARKALNEILSDADAKVAELKQSEGQIEERRVSLATLAGKIGTLQALLANLEEQREQAQVAASKHTASVNELKLAQQSLSDIDGRIQVKKRELEQLKDRIDELKRDETRQSSLLKERLKRLKETNTDPSGVDDKKPNSASGDHKPTE